MLSQTTSITTPQQREQLSRSDETNHDAYVPIYNESDYSDFLYLAPPLSTEFLPLEPKAGEQSSALNFEKAKTRPVETPNTGTTPPPVTPTGGNSFQQKEYFRATFPAVCEESPSAEEERTGADRRENSSFVGVTPLKVDHNKLKDVRNSHSSHVTEPMGWWSEKATRAKHEWVDQGEEEEDGIEGDMWRDRFYE